MSVILYLAWYCVTLFYKASIIMQLVFMEFV